MTSIFGERKTGTLFGNATAPTGGLFGQPQPAQPTNSLFGASTAAPQQSSLFGGSQQQQQQPQQSSLFGNLTQNQGTQNQGSLFGASQQQQQQQQLSQFSNSIFGGMAAPAPSLPALQASQLQQSQYGLPKLGQPGNAFDGQREKSVMDQMAILEGKWNPTNPNCAFQFYFYNQVKPEEAPFYGPAPHEDHRKWEEALAKKPSPGSIPVLARGFEEIAQRIHMQNLAVTGLQTRLHEINSSLTALKSSHELDIASRVATARQRHVEFTRRTLELATKVQILRNRGYVMDQAEEELKKKLLELEKKTFDPVLGGRQEEIWARMSGVRERAKILQDETEKLGKAVESQQNGGVLSEEDQKQIDKLLKDYDKQLEHLKTWVDDTKQEYDEWEKEKKPLKTGR